MNKKKEKLFPYEVVVFCEITYRVNALNALDAENKAIADIDAALLANREHDKHASFESVIYSDAINTLMEGEK